MLERWLERNLIWHQFQTGTWNSKLKPKERSDRRPEYQDHMQESLSTAPRMSREKRINTATRWILAGGALITVGALGYSARGIQPLFSGLTVWAIAPYGALLGCTALAQSRGPALSTLVVSLLIVAFAALICQRYLILQSKVSSTSALVFRCSSRLWQIVAALLLLVTLLIIRKRNRRAF